MDLKAYREDYLKQGHEKFAERISIDPSAVEQWEKR